MSVTPIRNLRVSDAVYERWQAAARERGVSLTRLVHVAMERELARCGSGREITFNASDADAGDLGFYRRPDPKGKS